MNYINLLLLTFLFAGCCSSESTHKNYLIYNITIGSGGGFTGNYEGYYIDSIGVIQKWSGKNIEAAKFETTGILSSEQITQLNEIINSTDIMKVSYRHPGNMTQFITLRKDSLINKISWEGTFPGAGVPGEVRRLYLKINDLIKNSH